ncbi:mRNA splicing protein [Coemansia sp. RSA 1722]|nr:mRNA splicing protein [Coemansia sp. RSA 485]KAJ2602049.1 mRNA splicing protein [Coemansia sp. RSA 1722]
MSSLSQFLPEPKHRTTTTTTDKRPAAATEQPSSTALITTNIPALGHRKGWVPKTEADFGDGGAYPEIHVLQYPRGMGRKKTKRGNALAKQVDAEGKIDYEALARQGRRPNETVQATFKELIPLRQRADFNDEEQRAIPDRPDTEAVREATERTKLALEKIVGGRVAGTAGKHAAGNKNEPSFVRYTPNQQAPGFNSGASQRIVRISNMPVDPMEPPKTKLQKATKRPASPPAPVMHSPPRKLTSDEQRQWVIPPCVSNWKNIHGFTVSLDKRLAADGRHGSEQIEVGDNFARLAEALGTAETQARNEIAERARIQQTLAQREKDAKEERLRELAQRAREERAAARADGIEEEVKEEKAEVQSELLARGSVSHGPSVQHRGRKTARDFFDPSAATEPVAAATATADIDSDDDGVRQRDAARREMRKQHERELRKGRNNDERRRTETRDISEKIALGIAKPTAATRETLFDSRLFNQPSVSNAQMQNDEAYNLYDKPLFATAGRSANYRPRISNDEEDAGEVARMMGADRFGSDSKLHGLDQPSNKKQKTELRKAPVEFEKGDVFGIDDFVGSARNGQK